MPNAIPADELRARLKRFRAMLDRERLGGALITDFINVRYLSGFAGGDSALFVTPRQRLLLTDFRYVEEAAHQAPGWKVVTKPAALLEKAGVLAKKFRVRKLAVESGHLTLGMAKGLQKFARGVALKPMNQMVEELRIIKSPWEVRQLEAALRIQERCFGEVCRMLRPGIREYEAAAEMRYRLVKGGADDQSFECMFQWGSNASRPHGRPTDRKLQESNIVLIDWGAKFNGYHGDLTRTFFLGTIPARLRKIHEIVAQAQQQAVERIAPGVEFANVDRAARDLIDKAGYKKQFGHSTGHGIGLKIHEAPTLSWRGKGVLKPGMVVTVEPGIYLPGAGGVRIEDDVLVTERGCRKLSRVPIGLRWNGANA
ncbi:MAG: aminopeptidase P family protein [Planctomycetota bacterium]|nr:aminopeptidase P family protein [Planctomycetota bacterium]